MRPRLEVGPVDDPLEREADRVAAQVMAGTSGPALPSGTGHPASVDGPRQPLPGATTLTTGGSPLSPPLRDFFEPRLGQDLRHVRVHTGATSQAYNQGLGALAFTLGHHVWLGRGAQPAASGLMAHELAHVVQQGGGTPQHVQRAPAGCPDDVGLPPVPTLPDFARDPDLDAVRASIFERDHLALQRGDTGDGVVLVQALLLNDVCTGIDREALAEEWAERAYGPATRAAVRQYQKTHVDALGRALDVDGRVGPLTLGALDGTLGLPVVRPARDPEGTGDCHGVAEQGPGQAEQLMPAAVPAFGLFRPSDAVWTLSNFDVARHFVKTEHREFLRSTVVPRINALPKGGKQVRIIGEASTTASDDFNLKLSERRAACMQAALLDAGLDDAGRIGDVVGYGERLTMLNRFLAGATPLDGVEDRSARRASIVLQSVTADDDCSDADRTRDSTVFIAGAACDTPVTLRVHIGDLSDPAKPTWREFIWWHMPWPPGCQFTPGSPVPGLPLLTPMRTKLPFHLARAQPDDPASASDFDGQSHITNSFMPGGMNFLIGDINDYGLPLPGPWNKPDCADSASGTTGWLRPIGPVHCGEMPAPVPRCLAVPEEDCPDAYLETPAQKYKAALLGGSADISSVLGKRLGSLVPLGGSVVVLALATTDLPKRQLVRFFAYSGISFQGGGSGLDRLAAATAPVKDVGKPVQLQQAGSGPSSFPFARSDFSLHLNALLTMAGSSNRIDLETGEGTFSFNGPHCNGGAERVYHGVIRPITPAFCMDEPLPDVTFKASDCKDACSDDTLLAGHRHLRVRVGRATSMGLPPGMDDLAQRYGCQLVAAELNVDTDDEDGGPIQRPLALLMQAADCAYTVSRADVQLDLVVPRRLALDDPRKFDAESDLVGAARLDDAGNLLIVGSSRPLRFALPGSWDPACTGKRGALGVVLPLGRVDCGLAEEPDHDTRPEVNHTQECEAFHKANPAMVDDAIARLKAGEFAPLIAALGPAPRVLVPPVVYEHWLRTLRPGDVVHDAPFVGKAPGAAGDVHVVGFASFKLLAINTDRTMNVEFLTSLCAYDAAGNVVALRPRGCSDGFIRPGDVRRIQTLDFGRRPPPPPPKPKPKAPGPDDGGGFTA